MKTLIFFMLFVTIFALGSGENIEKELIKEMMVVEIQTPLEKAEAAMARVNDRRAETYQEAEIAGDFSVLFTAAEPIFQEELGFGVEVWEALLNTWEDAHDERVQGFLAAGKEDESKAEALEYVNFLGYYFSKFEDPENPEGGLIRGEFWFEYMAAYDDIIIEYLRLSYESPDSTQAVLLVSLKKSIVDGKVNIKYPEEYPEE
jgi:hypothetical protein